MIPYLAEMIAGAAAIVGPLVASSTAELAGVAGVAVVRPETGLVAFVGSVVLTAIAVHGGNASPVMDAVGRPTGRRTGGGA